MEVHEGYDFVACHLRLCVLFGERLDLVSAQTRRYGQRVAPHLPTSHAPSCSDQGVPGPGNAALSPTVTELYWM